MYSYEDKKRPSTQYSLLGQEPNWNCTSHSICSCRFLYPRSSFDQMQCNHYTHGQPIHLPIVKNFPSWNKF